MKKRKQDVYCSCLERLASLPKPKWPRLDQHWTDEDIAQADMVNSLLLEFRPIHSHMVRGDGEGHNQLDTRQG